MFTSIHFGVHFVSMEAIGSELILLGRRQQLLDNCANEVEPRLLIAKNRGHHVPTGGLFPPGLVREEASLFSMASAAFLEQLLTSYFFCQKVTV